VSLFFLLKIGIFFSFSFGVVLRVPVLGGLIRTGLVEFYDCDETRSPARLVCWCFAFPFVLVAVSCAGDGTDFYFILVFSFSFWSGFGERGVRGRRGVGRRFHLASSRRRC
jgi:preprotein translocase subunit Sec61beta